MNEISGISDLRSFFQIVSVDRAVRTISWRESYPLFKQIIGGRYRSHRDAVAQLHQLYSNPIAPPECNCEPARGRRWMVSPVKVHYAQAGQQFNYLSIIQQVVAEVMSHCGVVLEFVARAEDSHIAISNGALDGLGGTLGQAYVPRSGDDMAACGPMCGDITIDTAERWTVAYFRTVFMHELLHALGVPHNTDRRSIMYFQYIGPRGLHELDIQELVTRHPLRVFT